MNERTVYLELEAAAAYTGQSPEYIMRQTRLEKIRHIKPSVRKTLYRTSDLDEWMKSWTVIEPKTH